MSELSVYGRIMLLSDVDLEKSLGMGLRVEPYDAALLQPASVDVRLAREFRVFTGYRDACVDPLDVPEDLTELVTVVAGTPFVLHPGEFVLGSTFERVTLGADLAGRLEGKSSLGRLGLLVHSTAGFIDPGFSGHVTLELSNASRLPIKLWPGMAIGQLCVLRMTSPAGRPYGSAGLGSHYQGQRGPTPPRSLSGLVAVEP